MELVNHMDRTYGTLIKIMFMHNGLKPGVTKWPGLWLFKKMINNCVILENLMPTPNIIESTMILTC